MEEPKQAPEELPATTAPTAQEEASSVESGSRQENTPVSSAPDQVNAASVVTPAPTPSTSTAVPVTTASATAPTTTASTVATAAETDAKEGSDSDDEDDDEGKSTF